MNAGVFSIARSALLVHQTALQTISQNIANAETPGYSRQEAQLAANTPVNFTYGAVGTGVSVTNIIRKRDILLDDAFRSAAGLDGDAGMRRDLLSQLESVFGEPNDAGMANALDQFWNSWSDLSAQPGSLAARAVVQQRGRQLSQMFNDFDTQLTTLRTSNLERLTNAVGNINSLAQQVAELNVRIVTSESNGNMANDLRDMRDLKLDELSRVAGTRVINQANGSVTVQIGNSVLVEGDSATPLSANYETITPTPSFPVTDVPVRIRLGSNPDRLAPLSGELGAMVDFLNTEIPASRTRLDAMADQLVTAVNNVHSTGYLFPTGTVPGTAAGNFFQPATGAVPVRASNLRLHADILADPRNISASGSISGPSDNTVAQGLASLRISPNTVTYTGPNGATETGSFSTFFRGLVTRVGIQAQSANDQAGVTSTLVEQAERRRQSVSGVSTDEELVNMLRVQQSYQAATKLIKAAEEMLDTLLNLV
jgi:flagellar hook-associated protein 1 FlgK